MNGKDELSVPQSAAVQGPVAMYYTSVRSAVSCLVVTSAS